MMEWESFGKHQERKGVTIVAVPYPNHGTNLSLNKMVSVSNHFASSLITLSQC